MKTLKIAFYDFKRLVFNPITYFGIGIILILTAILGIFYSPTITPAYSLSYESETSEELFNNFYYSNEADSKSNLVAIIENNENLIDAQRTNEIATEFESVKATLDELFREIQYIVSYPNGDPLYNNVENVNRRNEYLNFVEKVKNAEVFESTLYFTESDLKVLTNLADMLSSTLFAASDNNSIRTIYANVWAQRDLYYAFTSLEPINYEMDEEVLNSLEESFVTNAQAKLDSIEEEFLNLYQNNANLTDLESLILNYKLVAESAGSALNDSLYIELIHSFPTYANFIGYETQEEVELLQNLALRNSAISSEELYYQNHLSPMDFNKATGESTAYDFAYYEMCIVGFVLTICAIFFVYKLFGRDRQTGKVDMVLSQNVSFYSAFGGKFLAIVFSTLFLLFLFSALYLIAGYLIYGVTFTPILTVFNYTTTFSISPILYLLIKFFCIELEILFYVIISMFIMNLSRKFELMFAISLLVFGAGLVMNIFLSGFFVYTIFPFVHSNLFTFFGGGAVNFGFLTTKLVAGGSFYISIIYYLVLMIALYNFTNQLFKRN